MKSPPKSSEAVRQAAQVDRDGAAFFRRANLLAADPRVKFIFGRAAETFENAAKVLEPVAKGRGKPKVPAVFPFEEYEEIECYVCGHVARADDLPEVCPECGAARYAFEREVSQGGAWDLVLRTTKEAAAFARKVATAVKDTEQKEALAKAAELRKGLLDEAKEERARMEGATP
ncbi:MAG: hypothetical protein E6K18_00870 [Methanobacteriota archaeon]|nr:MAG: hypothetical protein E6K18_00870 [Euryarchaeota archaeon]